MLYIWSSAVMQVMNVSLRVSKYGREKGTGELLESRVIGVCIADEKHCRRLLWRVILGIISGAISTKCPWAFVLIEHLVLTLFFLQIGNPLRN